MNTLFNTTFENEEASHYGNKVHLHPQTYELQESNVNLKLTIVHTVGFGDQINREERYVLVCLYLFTKTAIRILNERHSFNVGLIPIFKKGKQFKILPWLPSSFRRLT